MKLTIIGRPIAKKNSKRLIRAKGRIIPIPSKAYKKFEESALEQLVTQRRGQPITTQCHVHYEFYIKGKYHVDLDNLIAGINDILQKGNIIKDDDLITFITAKKIGGCAGWSTKLEIIKE